MKEVLLFVTLLLSSASFGQTIPGNAQMPALDTNGFPLSAVSVQMPTASVGGALNSPYSYTSVRPLTEINNTTDADAYPWLAPNGLHLYYITGTDSKLMFTERSTINSSFRPSTAVALATPYAPASCWLSPDELDIYFTANNTVYFAQRSSLTAPFGTPVLVTLTGLTTAFISAPSLSTTKDRLFLYASSIGIVEFSRTAAAAFTYVRTLPIPAGYMPYPGQLSKDNLTYFLGASSGTDKRSLYQLTRASAAVAFEASSFQQVQGINAITAYNGQPSMSTNMESVAFTGASLNTWVSNELYIATKGQVTAVTTKDNPLDVAVYPNPATDYIHLKYKYSAAHPGAFVVVSSTGKRVRTESLTNSSGQLTIDTKSLSNGIYFYQLSQLRDDKLAVSTGKFTVLH